MAMEKRGDIGPHTPDHNNKEDNKNKNNKNKNINNIKKDNDLTKKLSEQVKNTLKNKIIFDKDV